MKQINDIKKNLFFGFFFLSFIFSVFTPQKVHAAESKQSTIWKTELHDFQLLEYKKNVELLFSAYENKTQNSIAPTKTGRVALKIDTHSGEGLTTSKNLVRAIQNSLVKRGYEIQNIFLIDQDEQAIRKAGFLPPLSIGGNSFYGSPIIHSRSNEYYDDDWFYESPLPPHKSNALYFSAPERLQTKDNNTFDQSRRSLLAMPLIQNIDFWINLPVITDHHKLRLNGALINSSLWGITNNQRFLNNTASGQAAASEIAAIPELQENHRFTLVSLEKFQFIGGPNFNSRYTRSLPQLLLSEDMVAIDSIAVNIINTERKNAGFKPLKRPEQLNYANLLNLGNTDINKIAIQEIE